MQESRSFKHRYINNEVIHFVGSELPCAEGESSPTGFTPGCSIGTF